VIQFQVPILFLIELMNCEQFENIMNSCFICVLTVKYSGNIFQKSILKFYSNRYIAVGLGFVS
jgi:hypothetical protein